MDRKDRFIAKESDFVIVRPAPKKKEKKKDAPEKKDVKRKQC